MMRSRYNKPTLFNIHHICFDSDINMLRSIKMIYKYQLTMILQHFSIIEKLVIIKNDNDVLMIIK